jgi:hypothetical protein
MTRIGEPLPSLILRGTLTIQKTPGIRRVVLEVQAGVQMGASVLVCQQLAHRCWVPSVPLNAEALGMSRKDRLPGSIVCERSTTFSPRRLSNRFSPAKGSVTACLRHPADGGR